jgi:phage-related protein
MDYALRPKKITVRFFRTSNGREPVRDWLKERDKAEREMIGERLKKIEFTWPVGYPLVTKLDSRLWEVRIPIRDGICRIFFTVYKRDMMLLHGIIKKSQKTPAKELEVAQKRSHIVWMEGENNEET